MRNTALVTLTRILVLGLLVAVGLAACDVTGTGAPAAAVQVTVRIDEQPAPEVAVSLFEVAGSDPVEQAMTEADGVALLSNIDPGTYEVGVVVPDSIPLAAGQPDRVQVAVFGGQTVTLLFRLTGETEDNVVVVHLRQDRTFEPADVTIAPGTAVRWYNDEAVTHTVTPDGHSEWQEANLTQEGQAFSHTFQNEGVFPYYSAPFLSQGMTGTITVVAPDR